MQIPAGQGNGGVGGDVRAGRKARAAVAIVLAGVVAMMGGCSSVARKIIQGTDHGVAAAVVPASERYELVRLRTGDGTEIVAQFGRAADAEGVERADGATRPTVIYCYAGGHTLRRSAAVFEAFRRLGVNVIVPEYPGFGMSEGRATEEGCYAAADAVYDHVRGRRDVDAAKIVVAGWSVGGGVAVDLASRREVAGVIAIATATSMKEVARGMVAGRAPWSWTPDWVFGVLMSRSRFDSIAKMPSVNAPAMFIEAGADELVSTEMTRRMRTAAKGPVALYTVEGARHANVMTEGDEGLWRALAGWIEGL